MRVKLDENLGERGARLLRNRGCDVETVVSQGLCTSSDQALIEVCRVEERVLVTLDKDFSNTTHFRPCQFGGIVVLRLPEPLTPQDIDEALARMLTLTANRSPVGRLWIIDRHRIREFIEEEGTS